MKCSNCGNEIPQGNAFCMSCGTPVNTNEQAGASTKTLCSNCGAEIPEGNTFCVSCGTKVGEAAAQQNNTAPVIPQPQQPVNVANPAQPQGVNQMPAVAPVAAQVAQTNASSKTNTGLIVGIIVAAVVLVIAIVCIVVFVLGPNNDKANQKQETQTAMAVPSVTNMSLSQAQSTLSSAGYSVDVEYSDGEKDVVLKQSPTAGTKLEKGSKVTLTVGKGTNGTHEVSLTVTNPRTNTPVTSTIRLNGNDEVIPDLLTKKYTRAEIEAMNLSDAELYIARNSIVAHQGYIFQYQPNTEFFTKNCSWYHPTTHQYSLNGIPSENATTILDIEHARNSWYPEIK